MSEDTDLFKDVELESPLNTDTTVKDVIDAGINPTDAGWNDYVLGFFDEKTEMYDGRPLCHGLRRVAELLLGEIVSSRPIQVFPPKDDHGIGRATVVWEVIFSSGACFSDVADCWEGNTDDTFCVFNTSTAATRAEGRALRKALRLRVVAAEELTKKNTADIAKSISKSSGIQKTEGEYNASDRMTDNQSNFIDVKCKQLDIDGKGFFKEEFNLMVSRKISKKQAHEAIEKLNELQQNKGSISESIKGYNSNWRSA